MQYEKQKHKIPTDKHKIRFRGIQKNWTGLTTFTQIPSIWWKNCENRSRRSWDSFAQFKKRKTLRR